MKVTVTPILIGVLGTINKALVKGMEEFEIKLRSKNLKEAYYCHNYLF